MKLKLKCYQNILLIILLLLFCTVNKIESKYLPDWDSLDSRPLPTWYDDAKIGIFIHWGVYSVPPYGDEWFWHNWKIANESHYIEFMAKNYPPGYTYQDFGPEFKAELYNPEKWVDLFKKAGARYVVLTSKHHEGFSLFPSKYSFGWNSVDIGPQRDLVGDLANAIRNKTDMKFGLYYSLLEWFNHLYRSDSNSKFTQHEYITYKMYPELLQLVNDYKPEIIWSDGDWESTDDYFQSKQFLQWLFDTSPVNGTVVVNDRWGQGTLCKHGSFYTCGDKFNPGKLQNHKWENAMPIDKNSWGFRQDDHLSAYMEIEELINTLVITVSCGGNILLNVGPTKYGTIEPIFEERLLQMGKWLERNGEAIYESKPWLFQNETDVKVWYTSKSDVVYAIVLDWPLEDVLQLKNAVRLFTNKTEVSLLDGDSVYVLQWNISTDGSIVDISFPNKALIKGTWAWSLKIVTK